MECVINKLEEAIRVSFVKPNEEFKKELALGHYYSLIYEKQRELNQYLSAYNELEDKDSFNAEYIASIIYILNKEIQELKMFY